MKEVTFEAAMARIDEINELIASGETTLDRSLELFKEAASLIAFCNKRLSEAKLEVEEIRKEVLDS